MSKGLIPLRERWWNVQYAFSAPSWRHRQLYARMALNQPRAHVRVAHGVLCVDLRDRGVGRRIYLDGCHEESEGAVLRALVNDSSVVIDIGANLGYFTTMLARMARTVVAIEPDPYNRELLLHNVAANRLSNVTVVDSAVGSCVSHATLYRSDINFGDHQLMVDANRAAIQVRVLPVDDIVANLGIRAVDLVKIDIQGFEVEAFRGMRRTLVSNPQMVIVAEFWPGGLKKAGTTVNEWLDVLSAAGFNRFSVIDDNGQEREVGSDWFLSVPDKEYPNVVIRSAHGM